MRRILLLSAMLIAGAVQAQDLQIKQGDHEFNGSANFNQAAFGGNFRMGIFFTDGLQLGGEVNYFDSDFYIRYSAGAFVSMHFDNGSYWIPYIGSGLHLAALEPVFLEKETGVEFEIFGGVKYFLADNVSVNTELRLGYSSANTYLEDNEYTDTDYRLNIGLSYYW